MVVAEATIHTRFGSLDSHRSSTPLPLNCALLRIAMATAALDDSTVVDINPVYIVAVATFFVNNIV